MIDEERLAWSASRHPQPGYARWWLANHAGRLVESISWLDGFSFEGKTQAEIAAATISVEERRCACACGFSTASLEDQYIVGHEPAARTRRTGDLAVYFAADNARLRQVADARQRAQQIAHAIR